MSLKDTLWVEKYRPRTLDDYVWQDPSIKAKFQQFVNVNNVPHLLLIGSPGTGKTALAKILINELQIDEMDVLVINASDENSIDVLREKISGFVECYANGSFKYVLLDECDFLSINAQAGLRNLIESSSDNARFVLTANYENKIIPALKSRLQTFNMKAPDRDSVLERCINMLLSEDIVFNPVDLDTYVRSTYPDIRKTINVLQQNVTNGELIVHSTDVSSDWRVSLIDLIKVSDWQTARQLICASASPEEIESVYEFLYKNLDVCERFAADIGIYNSAIIIIAKYLNMHALSADTEITLAACIIELGRL